MKLLWHLARKDLRRLRLPLAFFAALLVSRLAIGVLLLHPDAGALDFDRANALLGYSFILVALQLLVAYVLVAALVQEDNLIGTRAFWLTKPISGLQLLGAKALALVAIFGALPVFVDLPWWLACGLGPLDLLRSTVTAVVPFFAVAAIAWPIAALTPNFARFLTWTLIGVGVVVVVAMNLAAHNIPGLPVHHRPGLGETRAVLATLAALVGLGLVLGFQYRTRHFVRAVFVLASTLVVVAAILWAWAWDWSALWHRPTGPGSALAQAIELKFDRAALETHSDPQRPADLVFALTTGAVPPDLRLTGVTLDGRLSSPGGAPLETSQWQFKWWYPSHDLSPLLGIPASRPDPAWLAYRAKKPPGKNSSSLAPDAPGGRLRLVASAQLPSSLAPQLLETPPACDLDAEFQIGRAAKVGEAPWSPGSVISDGRHYCRVAQADRSQADRLRLDLIVRIPASSLFTAFLSHSVTSAAGEFALANRSRQNLRRVWAGGTPVIQIAGVEIYWLRCYFWPAADWDPAREKFLPQPHWFDAATLVYFVEHPVERFRRALHTDRLDTTANSASVWSLE